MAFNRVIFLRRMSALFIFFVVLLTFFVLYYYKYVPDNKSELNQRGHRVLTQLIQNFLRKDQDLHNIIENSGGGYQKLLNRTSPYDRLYTNMHYAVDTIRGDTANVPHLMATDTGVWLIRHRNELATGPTARKLITVKVKDFADPVFASRSDIFQNYLILYDSNESATASATGSHLLSLIYQQNTLSAAAGVNTDTLQSMAKNSDESGVFELSISGEKYVAFFARFAFHQQPLMLTGLILKDTYDRKVEATPVYFLPLMIILISLVMIALPFLKIFLLSPRESINRFDVLKTALSFYAGSAAFTIIIFYFFLSYVTDMSLHTRLRHFAAKVQTDLEQEIRQADQQLKDYDTSIGSLPLTLTPIKDILSTNDTADTAINSMIVNYACTPGVYPGVTRLFWANRSGATIAKWSPFGYPTPFTNLNSYVFFQQLLNKPAWFNGIAGSDQPVLYPGKSNLTDEFQTFIGRESHSSWPASARRPPAYQHPATSPNPTDSPQSAAFIAIAATLHSTLQPVIPEGFGFSIIDNSGKVLIDGDNLRSLGENLFMESANNKELLNSIRFNNSNNAFPLELYGETYTAIVMPVAGQPLHLACYYEQKALLANIDRFLHFSIHTLVVLWILLILCLLLSTYNQWRPVLLSFNMDKEEWIRPSSTDPERLASIFRYFSKLTLLSLAFFMGIEIFSTTLIPLFYISLLLPFYTLTRVQIAHQWKGWVYSVISILVLNAVILWLIANTGKDFSLLVPPLLFQLCAVLPLLPWPSWQPKDSYFPTLYLSIILIGVLPTLGILNYGFYAEKIQYKKYKLAHAATGFFRRSNYLLTNWIPSYKPQVLANLGVDYQQDLVFRNSIYLTDHDTIEAVPSAPAGTPLLPSTHDLPDGLYDFLMDKCYFAPQIWDDDLSIPDASADGEWAYQKVNNGIQYVSLRPVGNSDLGRQNIHIRSHLQKPHGDLLAIWLVAGWIGLVLLALLYLAGKLANSAIRRLFLNDFIDEVNNNKIAVDPDYLKQFFVPDAMAGRVSYLKILTIGNTPFSINFLQREKSFGGAMPGSQGQQEFILALADYLSPVYAAIWKSLSDEEKYILHDFSSDRYTNYKNSTTLYKLVGKGILTTDNRVLDVFSLSFRQYVLSQETAVDITRVRQEFSLPGAWQSIRIPVISILIVMAIFLFKTHPEIGTFMTGLVALLGSFSAVMNYFPQSKSS
jgi:hypothetical protein